VTIPRLDHVSVIVDDLEAAKAFFVELGLELEGQARMDGDWVDRVNGIDGIRVEIAMMRTPDGHGKLELTEFHHPALTSPEPSNDPPNTLGLRTVMFEVDDIDDVVERLRAHGGALIGEIVEYEGVYRLCYLRGPAGMIVALAEALG
jgi:catechol 2,3-dioxygenase-like lactoylglutathione lyase family enzyme